MQDGRVDCRQEHTRGEELGIWCTVAGIFPTVQLLGEQLMASIKQR